MWRSFVQTESESLSRVEGGDGDVITGLGGTGPRWPKGPGSVVALMAKPGLFFSRDPVI